VPAVDQTGNFSALKEAHRCVTVKIPLCRNDKEIRRVNYYYLDIHMVVDMP